MVISDYLPHKGNMILVDDVHLGNTMGGCVYGYGMRKIKKNEYWAKGHFGIMPASAMIETMAQVAGCIFLCCHKTYMGKEFYLVGVDKSKFIKPVHIGDEIEIDVQVHPNREHFVVVDCMIRRENEKIASAELMLWGTHE